mgnify:CR=1 FL=1
MKTWSEAIREWQRETFGTVAPTRSYGRMLEELKEFRDKAEGMSNNPEVAEEAADVVITLAAFVATLGLDLATEVEKKMAINRARKWRVDGDGCGYHIKEEKG